MLTEKKKHRARFYYFDELSKRVRVRDYILMCVLAGKTPGKSPKKLPIRRYFYPFNEHGII